MEEFVAHLLEDLTNPAHLTFEAIMEVMFFTVEYAIIRKAIATYDRVKHGHKHNGGSHGSLA